MHKDSAAIYDERLGLWNWSWRNSKSASGSCGIWWGGRSGEVGGEEAPFKGGG